MQLGKDVFLALAAIAWADGEVADSEADAIRRAAKACQLAAPEMAEIEQALRFPISLGRLTDLRLDRDQRLFLYGLATWLARADGIVHRQEVRALELLGNALGLSNLERSRAKAACIVNPPFPAPGESQPHNLDALAKVLEQGREIPPLRVVK